MPKYSSSENGDFIIFHDIINQESGMHQQGGSSILCDVINITKLNTIDEWACLEGSRWLHSYVLCLGSNTWKNRLHWVMKSIYVWPLQHGSLGESVFLLGSSGVPEVVFQVWECHFHHIPLFQHAIKVSLGSRERELMLSLNERGNNL